MSRKIELLAGEKDLTIKHICPRYWQDELLRVEQPALANDSYEQMAIPMIGRASDPHRALYRSLAFEMGRFRPHIIHAEEEPDSLAALQIALARRAFAPEAKLVLYTWQNINRPKRWHVKAVLRATLGAADAVLCANCEAVEVLSEMGYRKRASELLAIGVDTRVFAPRQAGPQGSFVVGYVGRLVAEKGLDVLLSAVSMVNRGPAFESPDGRDRRVEVVIVGDGPQRSVLEAQARSAGLAERVRFVPPMPPNLVAEQMSQLDALVLPSRTTAVWKEQFGRVLVEAMSCKVPVVGSDSGAIPEVIGDAGLIFPEGDAAALAACLRRLMESPDLCAELGERGYTRATTCYSQERIAEQTAEFYRVMMR